MLMLVLALLFGLRALAQRLWQKRLSRSYRRIASGSAPFFRRRRKPDWVRREIVHLAAMLAKLACRPIAHIFNRRFGPVRNMTVGKTFVNGVLRDQRYAIELKRRRIKNASPRPVPRSLIWGLDLTGKTDSAGRLHPVLGLVDHGSRANLALAALPNKSSFTLLGQLFLAIGAFSRPRAIRTDNEAVFTSRLFRLALLLLGIRHQRTDLRCPWQNGRIERLFGTLKAKLDSLAVDSIDALNQALAEFRFFYNHVRPHQNLAGATPAEAWSGVDPYTATIRDHFWFDAWDGLLQGYYLRR